MVRGEGIPLLREGDGVGVLSNCWLSCDDWRVRGDCFESEVLRGKLAGRGEKTFDKRAGFRGVLASAVKGSSFSVVACTMKEGLLLDISRDLPALRDERREKGELLGTTVPPRVPRRIRRGGGISSSDNLRVGLLITSGVPELRFVLSMPNAERTFSGVRRGLCAGLLPKTNSAAGGLRIDASSML